MTVSGLHPAHLPAPRHPSTGAGSRPSALLESLGDVVGRQVEVEASGVQRIEQLKSEPLPPRPCLIAQSHYDDGLACCLRVQLRRRSKDVSDQRGTDTEARVPQVDRQATEQQRRHELRRALTEAWGATTPSIAVIERAAYATTSPDSSVITQVAAVFARRLCPE